MSKLSHPHHCFIHPLSLSTEHSRFGLSGNMKYLWELFMLWLTADLANNSGSEQHSPCIQWSALWERWAVLNQSHHAASANLMSCWQWLTQTLEINRMKWNSEQDHIKVYTKPSEIWQKHRSINKMCLSGKTQNVSKVVCF